MRYRKLHQRQGGTREWPKLTADPDVVSNRVLQQIRGVKRTLIAGTGMSALCQKWTLHVLVAMSANFGHCILSVVRIFRTNWIRICERVWPVVLGQRFTCDVVGHNARDKVPTFDADEADSLEKLVQLSWRIEVPYRIREVPNTFHALGRAPEKLCRKPYRETQIG